MSIAPRGEHRLAGHIPKITQITLDGSVGPEVDGNFIPGNFDGNVVSTLSLGTAVKLMPIVTEATRPKLRVDPDTFIAIHKACTVYNFWREDHDIKFVNAMTEILGPDIFKEVQSFKSTGGVDVVFMRQWAGYRKIELERGAI